MDGKSGQKGAAAAACVSAAQASRLALTVADRVLVVAPHPDDETLAAGGLLQQAVEAGAAVAIVLLTAGDNNPWPQRWLEGRWRIDAAGRQRWGRRRLGEMRRAVAMLGLDEGALWFAGWPDLGLTERMLAESEAMVGMLAERLARFGPTHVILPALEDRHPDHGAAHVLTMAAAQTAGIEPQCLTYLVHGRAPAATALSLSLNPRELTTKRGALLAHHSQMQLLGRRRLDGMPAIEVFWSLPPARACHEVAPRWLLPGWRRGCELVLHQSGRTWREPVPAELGQHLASRASAHGPLYAKCRWRGPSPWIFDIWGWRHLANALDRNRASG